MNKVIALGRDMMLTSDEYMSLMRLITSERESEGATEASQASAKKRKPSAYSKRYGKAFNKVEGDFKKKNGGWKKNGFKNAQKAAHALAKK